MAHQTADGVLEEVPKGTLLNIMKRKEKELRAAVSRVELLQGKNALLDRRNAILTADRKSFRLLAQRLRADLTAFEAADAKDEPIDSDELVGSIDFVDYKTLLCDFHYKCLGHALHLPDEKTQIADLLDEAVADKKKFERAEFARLNDEFALKAQTITDLQDQLSEVKKTVDKLTSELKTSETEIDRLAIRERNLLAELSASKNNYANLDFESQRKSDGFAKLLFEQEEEISDLRTKQSSLDALACIAERQAERDCEIGQLKKEIQRLHGEMRGQTNSPDPREGNHLLTSGYLKSVLLKWLVFVKDGDPKRSALVPVLEQLLQLTDVEKHIVSSL